MAIRRYGVLDADGVKLTTILVDEKTVTDYWPGYGAKLIDEGPEPEEPKAPPAPPRPDDFGVIDFKLDAPMQPGDRIDFRTGEVTKAKLDPGVEEAVAADALAEK
jgi:hypothetical protein